MPDTEIQRHHGPVNLTLFRRNAATGGSDHWQSAAVPVVLQRTTAMTSLLVDGPVREQLASPGLWRARVVLPDGQVIVGAVQGVMTDYFEVIEDGQP